jgi:hypothetical protein
MKDCPQCGLKYSTGFECPSCGHLRPPSDPFAKLGAPASLLKNYVNDVKTILLQPSQFFKNVPLKGGMSGPLTFALVTHWIGSAFSYLWALLAGGAIQNLVGRYVHFTSQSSLSGDIDSPARVSHLFEAQQKIAQVFWHWFWGTGSIILDPFMTLFSIFFTAFFVYVGARLFVNSLRQNEVTFESAVRLIAYGLTPAIIAVFPFLGAFVAAIYILVVTIIGAREMYQTSNSRALLIALFPKLLFFGIIALGFFAVLAFMFKLLVS